MDEKDAPVEAGQLWGNGSATTVATCGWESITVGTTANNSSVELGSLGRNQTIRQVWDDEFSAVGSEPKKGTHVIRSGLCKDIAEQSSIPSEPVSETPNRVQVWSSKLRHGPCNTYGRLFTIMIVGNVLPLLVGVILDFQEVAEIQAILEKSATICIHMASANAMVCTLARSPVVINALFVVCGAIPRSSPLWLRRRLCKIFHIGGVHSGTGIAACMWTMIFVIVFAFTKPWVSPRPTFILAMAVVVTALLIAIIVVAIPSIRRRCHDTFEMTHRFASWLTLAFLWALLLTQAYDEVVLDQMSSIGTYLLTFPTFWFLLVSSMAAMWPWTMLRKVDVTPEYLSPHAIRLHFSHRQARWGRGLSLARHPLRDWHSFATFTDQLDTPESKFSCLVSNAGDWTRSVIEARPTKLWIRAVPVCGLAYAMKVFSRLVVVTTGSGIGPCLSFIGYKDMPPLRVVWQSRCPLQTYGQRTLDLVKRMDPNPLIIDTSQGGRRDMLPEVLNMVRDFEAEAVIVISNPGFTEKIVYDLESKGIPAYGPIFDS
ncbi:hypothetical protein PFICI_14373 [Pestalotiopsis fici W106-1]|uniref:Integral membrane protein TmpA n=1 Tax=Pestalotiopsis fici (strain W106-1 / CGMCC3.15140) TaxID=1229662 RepID=W3WMW4_PESFW|nr:uncharacterized protein PFICI_14373 [Pestalotiopsis fici W106-1]ETS74507.1 hypothetical protein PFICI_14373 [Pestalotiopsis fici W106-1]